MKDIWEPQTHEDVDLPFFASLLYEVTERRIEWLKDIFKTQEVVPTGSRHIESPEKMDTDDDYLIYYPVAHSYQFDQLRDHLVDDGWTDCLFSKGGQPTEQYNEEKESSSYWGAFRKGEVNILIYAKKELYCACVYATTLCKKLNVKDKDRRIRIFRWFKYNEKILDGDLTMENK